MFESKYKREKRKYFQRRFAEVFSKEMSDHDYRVLCGCCKRKKGLHKVGRDYRGNRIFLEGEVLGECIVVVWDPFNRIATTFFKSS